MEYRVTRLLEPELEPFASSSGAYRVRSWLRPWMGLGLLMLVPGLLSGSRKEVAAAAAERPVTVEAQEEIPMDEWIRIVGVAPAEPVADVEPPRPQWSIRLPDVEETPGAQQLLAGNARSLAVGALPVELGRLLKMFGVAQSQLQLAAAGGEVSLVGSDLPPWMWKDTEVILDAPQAGAVFVTLPPELDGQARIGGLSAVVEGINYSDPTGVGLPLLRAGGFMENRISEHFLVKDFATRDFAPYMRVAVSLVAGLERLRNEVGPIEVISGYRHPRYNARADVGGARYSRHQAGQAADVFSTTRSSIELAHAAIRTMGCGIGLGLGRNTIHVDVRGYLSTWTYPGAPLREAVFDRWVLALCGGSAPQAPALSRRMSNEEWLALIADGAQDGEELIHLDDELVEEAVEVVEEIPAVLSADQLVQRDLAEFARLSFWSQGPGVVLVDLRDGERLEGPALHERARYVRSGSPVVRGLALDGLIEWVGKRPGGTFFVYAIRLPRGELRSGVAPTIPLPEGSVVLPPAIPAPSAAPTPRQPEVSPEPSVSREAPAPEAPVRWLVRLASSPSQAAMDRDIAYYQTLLASTGFTISPHYEGRGGALSYHVAVGPFADRAEAEAALERVRPFVGADAELIELALRRPSGAP